MSLMNVRKVYSALGSFKPVEPNEYARKSAYCTLKKTLWFDIDCGEEKYKAALEKDAIALGEDGQAAFINFLESLSYQCQHVCKQWSWLSYLLAWLGRTSHSVAKNGSP